MAWLEGHRHLLIGVFADGTTFAGACILARDAFLRLRELKRTRTSEEFERQFPGVNLTDEEMEAAIVARQWTLAGFALLVFGFFLQLVLRFLGD